MVDTAKLGLKSLAVGAVGEDEKADWVLLTLEKHGIDITPCSAFRCTDQCDILNVRPNGDRPALHVRGASDHFDLPPAMYDQGLRRENRASGGTGLLKKLDGPPSRIILQEAKKRGCITTFDLHRSQCGNGGHRRAATALDRLFHALDEEAQDMSGRKGPEDCAAFYLDKGATACVFTLGGDGAYYAHKDGTRLKSPAYEISVVDTTGCGDAFDAGMITALCRGMDLETSLRYSRRPPLRWWRAALARMPASFPLRWDDGGHAPHADPAHVRQLLPPAAKSRNFAYFPQRSISALDEPSALNTLF